MKIKIIFIFSFCLFTFAKAQDRFDIIEEKLTQLSKNYPGLNDKVELSVSSAPIQEFIRAIGTNNNLNVNVDPTIDVKVSNNFNNVTAMDVFLFLCKKYDLDITFAGPIMSFTKYTAPIIPFKVPERKALNIIYQPGGDLISFDFLNDTIGNVAKEITKKSGKNIVFSSELIGKLISGYVQNVSFNNALEKLAFANDMKVSLTADNFYVFEKRSAAQGSTLNVNQISGATKSPTVSAKNYSITVVEGYISADVQNMSLTDILNYISKESGKEYFLFSELKGYTTIKVKDAPYDEFLKLLFNGTEFTFRKEGDIYLFGDRNLEGLRQNKVIILKNRPIDKMMEFIPAELKKGIDIKTFKDLNGLIVSGSQPRIDELETFIRQVDLVVPLVHIEVIIADVRKSNTFSAGVTAGIGSKPVSTTTGQALPQIDLSLNASSVNNLISGLNGFGVINLGNVTPNFYLTIKALEQQGILKLRSTPQIATLNGHEAKLSIGKTEYYLEVQNNLVNNLNSQQNILQSQQYKPVNADLSLSIDPQVSGDEQITMTINVKQSSFTERISNTAPPGAINRSFESLIRVKNGEMIMLGGLEETNNSHSGKGLPGLSRIPVLRWLFGERTKTKAQNKLTIFIKPTIIYS